MKRLRRGLTQGSTPTPGTAQSLPGCDSSSPALPLCLSLFFPHIKLQCCSLCWHCSHIQVTRSWSPSLFVFSIVFFFSSLSTRALCGNTFTPAPVPYSFCQAVWSWLISNPREFMSPVGFQETLHAGNKLLSPFHEKWFLILKVPSNPAQVCALSSHI